MIQSKEELKRYLDMDRFAYNTDRKYPKLIGDDIWKFLIVLRKHEYYTNVRKDICAKFIRRYYAFRHYRLGKRLGLEIPINSCGGG